MAQEYWKWPEMTWQVMGFKSDNEASIVAGVDIGTTSAQAVVFADDKLVGYSSINIGANYKAAAEKAIELALGDSGLTLDKISKIGATGFGKQNATFATEYFDEVLCHAKGARFIFGPKVKTVVDIGGQSTRAISLHSWDRVRDFYMNDKCATGFGRNIEKVSEYMQVPITEIGEFSLNVEKDPEPVSTTCYSFAESETMGLFTTVFREEPSTANEVVASYIFANAWRILGVIGKLAPLDIGEVSVEEGLAFTGGVAKNPGITKRIERALKVHALEGDYDPQLAGAIGAALLV